MNKILAKTNILLALLVLTLGPSSGVNAAANYAAPPRCNTGRAPDLGQAYVYTGTTYNGNCYVLSIDGSGDSWTSWDATTGFPNDQIQSVWVGPDVTLVLFWNDFNTKDNAVPLHFGPGQFSANLGNWNGKASAARVQTFPFGQCGATPNTLVLFTDANFNGGGLNDCTELVGGFYPNPVSMGFRNDTLSSIGNNYPGATLNSAATFNLFSNTYYWGNTRVICFGDWDPNLAGDGVSQANANNFFDQLSSISVGENTQCSGWQNLPIF